MAEFCLFIYLFIMMRMETWDLGKVNRLISMRLYLGFFFNIFIYDENGDMGLWGSK